MSTITKLKLIRYRTATGKVIRAVYDTDDEEVSAYGDSFVHSLVINHCYIQIYVKKTSSLSTVVRPTMTHIKQLKYFWHPTSRGHISLLLIYAIRSWPYTVYCLSTHWLQCIGVCHCSSPSKLTPIGAASATAPHPVTVNHAPSLYSELDWSTLQHI